MPPLLDVQNLTITLKGKPDITVVSRVSFTLNRGGTLGIIGESGSGKSLCCLGIMGLLDRERWNVEGDILLDGKALPYNDNQAMRPYRGSRLALIVQNPLSAFNQMITIGAHFYETLNKPGMPQKTREQVRSAASTLLSRMRIRDTEAALDAYAFQLSGGMLQRIMIALALIMEPDLLIADEPTTALDLTVQHEIIALLGELQEGSGTAMLLVSHDLGVVTHLASDIAVMYAGEFVEKGDAETVCSLPAHPYTRGLFASRPKFSKERLQTLEGQPPSITDWRKGCSFYRRCGKGADKCSVVSPPSFSVGNGHESRCFRHAESNGG